jgi:hypothetical protein
MYIENLIAGECREIEGDTDLSLRRSMIPEMQYYKRADPNTIFFPNEDMQDGASNVVNSAKNHAFSRTGISELTNLTFAPGGVTYCFKDGELADTVESDLLKRGFRKN